MSDHDGIPSIAIVGMAGRFPGAPDVDTLWANLCAGVESVRPVDIAALQAVGIDPSEPGFVNAVALMDDADAFDASFFGMSRREAELTDPQHRVLHETVWNTLEHAGYHPGDDAGRIGIFGGVGENYYFRFNLMAHSDLLDRSGFYPVRLANGREYAILRTAYKLGLTGPAIPVMTACSTSAVATHLAVQSLLAGECDLAVAGGAHLYVPGMHGYTYMEDSILSPDGHVRAFDADARGTVMGSGVAFVALKRVEDALADGDTIYAVIRGTAVNNDGAAKIGFTAPGLEGQRSVIEDAMAVADVDAASIGMLEAHGTGTSLGDPIEVAALTEAYRRHTDRRQYCTIGTLKSNIGHLDAAAGAAGLIKAALSLYHERIPPSINYDRPNPQIDFEASPFYVNTELLEWPRSDEPRRAGVSAFGFGGTNGHIVLEEAPRPQPVPAAPSGRPWVLTLSAKSVASLERRREMLADHLAADPAIELADAAHTLSVGRSRMPYRSALVAADVATAVSLLRDPQPQATATRMSTVDGAEVAFLFTGQGAQYLGMGKGLYVTEPAFATAIDECARIVREIGGHRLTDLLFGGSEDAAEAAARILHTDVGQPAIFTLQYALARLWESWGVRPSAFVGHSVGEIAAACLGGVLSLEDALGLAVIRGRLMADLPRGAMTAVLADERVVVPLLDEEISLAAVNAPEQCVASGPPESIDALEQRLAAADVAFRRLPTDRAFHSPMMEPSLEPLRAHVASLARGRMAIPMVSTLTGAWVSPDELAEPEYWSQHARQTVRFMDALGVVLTERPDLVLIEVGPGETLASLGRQHPSLTPDQTIISTLSSRGAEVDDVVHARKALGAAWTAGVDVDWKAVNGEGRRRVALPTYPFARDRYWVQGVGRPALVAPVEGSSTHHEPAPVAAPTAPTDDGGTQAGATHASRHERIAAQVIGILADLSGLDAADLDPSATFTNLGFDSLFLTQANSQFRRVFGIRFTLGQLLGETPSIDALATRIDVELPPDPEITPAPAAETALATAPIAYEPVRPVRPAAGPGVAGNGEHLQVDQVEALIMEQLRIMEEQLELMRSSAVSSDGVPTDATDAARSEVAQAG
jgi:acyl transferase domain-containing protein